MIKFHTLIRIFFRIFSKDFRFFPNTGKTEPLSKFRKETKFGISNSKFRVKLGLAFSHFFFKKLLCTKLKFGFERDPK